MNRKTKRYSIILIVATLLSQFAGHAGSIIYYIGVMLIYIPMKEKIVLFRTKILLYPILIAMIIGLFMKPYSLYEVFKDAFYLFSPIIMLILGEIFARKLSSKEFLVMIVIVGFFFSLINCVGNIITAGPQIFFDTRTVRNEGDNYFGLVNFYALLALYVLIYWRYFNKELLPHNWKLLMFINSLALYFAGSRTYWLVFIIVFFLMMGPVFSHKRYLFVFFILLILGLSAYIATSEGLFSTTIRQTLDEMTVSDYDNLSDKNEKYRGYEAFMALNEYQNYTSFNKIFGGGMGATVDMGIDSPVGIQYIPILHNGYPYLLIKMGVLGLLSFVYFFIYLIIRFKKADIIMGDKNEHFWRVVSYGSLISVLIMHFSVNAIFNALYNTSLIFVGYSLTNLVRNKNLANSRC